MASYRLKIELTGSHPSIWRRIQTPDDLFFSELHDIISMVMGWEDGLPYEFVIGQTKVYDFEARIDMGNNPYEKDSIEITLRELVTLEKTTFSYLLNPGNPRELRITLEKILAPGESKGIICIGGEGSFSPDGGVVIDLFDMEEVNANLADYFEQLEEINAENDDIIEEEDDFYDEESEYEFQKRFKSPKDLLESESDREEMLEYIEGALQDETSIEYKTYYRLVKTDQNQRKAKDLLCEALSIEWFYDLKYASGHLDARYEFNLDHLPEKPREMPSLDCALQVLDKSSKGIPFAAIEYLHDDDSREATSAIIKALNNFSNHQYCWQDCATTPIWYALAAEGHLCEELIDPVIAFYSGDNRNETDWLFEQGEYLIGKLAQKFPDTAAQKVLAVMEKDADEKSKGLLYYLFDVFYFCDIEKYKPRLIALLRRDDISWHDMLASTIGYLQIKEGLPILKEQLNANKSTWNRQHKIEIEEAIEELEKGEDLYPEVSAPLSLTRNATWKEKFSDAEEYFYDKNYFSDYDSDFDVEDDAGLQFQWPETRQPIVKGEKTGRNDPCPCGSGKKYKKCCLDKDIREGLY